MIEVSSHFLKGRIYADLDEMYLLTTYFQLISVDRRSKRLTFKVIGGNASRIKLTDGFYVCDYDIFYELSKREISRLKKEGIIKLL